MMSKKIKISRNFRKGDKVEIVGNIPFHLKKIPRPLLGTVTHVNGGYILVKPRYKKWEAEFYSNELRYLDKETYIKLVNDLRSIKQGKDLTPSL